MARTIILSVISAGARKEGFFAFQLQQEDKEKALLAEGLSIEIGNEVIEITNAIRAYKSFGRISHPDIHQWILEKRLHQTPHRNPTKLIFSFSERRKKHSLKLYPYQANLL